MLATGVNLIEPLIYREAINDIAGLFVQKAKEDTRLEYESGDENPITSLIEKAIPDESDSISQKVDKSKSNDPEQAKPEANKIVKVPHSRTQVADRSPQQRRNDSSILRFHHTKPALGMLFAT